MRRLDESRSQANLSRRTAHSKVGHGIDSVAGIIQRTDLGSIDGRERDRKGPRLTDVQTALLEKIFAAYPEPFTVDPETDDLLTLRDADLIEEWDMWPDGRRRWIIRPEGRNALAIRET